ncbi:MAG: GDSL-type esterase/lipase family protein [Pseudomonadota bacterium]|nr:GDSL-type esterase/lipase family protein [Pseudomonadota bacterium]
MTRTNFFSAGLLALALTACATAQEPAAPVIAEAPAPVISTDPIPFNANAPFASEIYNFFVQDELFPPTECRTVFTGSSSIRFWLTLEDDFPELEPLNRGFGGSEITHLIGYFDILLSRHQPREIIFYAGENDLNAGASPADMAARFDVFMDLKTERLGDAPVYFLSVKPSYARLGELDAQRAANAQIEAYAETRDDLIYVDIASPMMDGGVPKQIFITDQLHMNLDGYAIWTETLGSLLNDPDRPKRTGC